MVMNEDFLTFPISLIGIYFVGICGIGSLGTSPSVFQSSIKRLAYRIFFYQDLFSHVVVAYLLYSFRKVELLLGSHLYLSFLFTLSLAIIPTLFLFSSIFSHSDSCVLFCSSILTVFWKCVPSVKSTSLSLYKSFSISQHILLFFLVLLLAIHNSIVGIFEALLGMVIGRIFYKHVLLRHKVIPFPPIITRALIGLLRLIFVPAPVREASATPLFVGETVALSEEEDPLNEEDITALTNLGFSRMEAIFALRDCGFDVNAAAEQLLATV